MSITTHDRNDDEWKTAQDSHIQNTNNGVKDKCARIINQTEHVSLAGETNHVEEETSWYLDTGYSNLMTGNRKWLIDLDISVKSIVRFADNSVIRAEGLGQSVNHSKGCEIDVHAQRSVCAHNEEQSS